MNWILLLLVSLPMADGTLTDRIWVGQKFVTRDMCIARAAQYAPSLQPECVSKDDYTAGKLPEIKP